MTANQQDDTDRERMPNTLYQPTAAERCADPRVMIAELRRDARASVTEREDEASRNGEIYPHIPKAEDLLAWHAADMLQAVFDPENQPSQFGTALLPTPPVQAPAAGVGVGDREKAREILCAAEDSKCDGELNVADLVNSIARALADREAAAREEEAKHWRAAMRASTESLAAIRLNQREQCVKVAEAEKLGDNTMLSGTGMQAVHDGACNAIIAAIRALKP